MFTNIPIILPYNAQTVYLAQVRMGFAERITTNTVTRVAIRVFLDEFKLGRASTQITKRNCSLSSPFENELQSAQRRMATNCTRGLGSALEFVNYYL